MQAPAPEDVAIEKVATLFSDKHARGDIDQILVSLGVERVPPSDKFTKLRVVLLDLYRSRDIARLGSVIEALSKIHTLQSDETGQLERYKVALGVTRVATIDLGAYGSLSIDSDTRRMIRAYATLRSLENKLREFIDFKLRLNFEEKWWETQTSQRVKDSAIRARSKELSSPWQSVKTDADIYYTDFADLGRIMAMKENLPLFKESLIDEIVVFNKLKELELVRNIIAHNRTLSEIELTRLELYAHDILKSVGAIKD